MLSIVVASYVIEKPHEEDVWFLSCPALYS
jgi:hypothetical protein